MTIPTDNLKQAALAYAELGYPVFPVTPGQKKPPLTAHGYLDARSDPAQVEAWWDQHPQANIAIATAGLVVIDIDGADNSWLNDQPEKQLQLAAAPCSLTANGGRQFIFRQPTGKAWRNTAGRLAPQVDTRGDGGYIVVAPSVLEGGKTYRWQPTCELEQSPASLPTPPAWLVEMLDALDQPAPVAEIPPTSGNMIPEGQRNEALARLAGTMRRVGMSQAEILAALHRANSDRCRPVLPPQEVERIAASISRYQPDQVATALAEGHWQQMQAASEGPMYISVRELVAAYPDLREPVIHGLLRTGETMNLISAPKIGKSWLVIDLALSVVTGREWLGQFQCERGDVLILDNELHPETIANRIPRVAAARQIGVDQYADRLFVRSLRGQLKDIFTLGEYFHRIEAGRFRLIICDAFYRFLPRDTDENDNGTMANLYNVLDNYAGHTGASFVLIHHSTKGNQSLKAITDVGAGAGSQGRAADAHIIIRRHEEDDAVVIDGETRAWPKFPAACLRWTFPTWTPAPELDPADLRSDKPKKKDNGQSGWTPSQFAQSFVTSQPKLRDTILAAARQAGLSVWKATCLLRQAEAEGLIFRHSAGRNRPCCYATLPQLEGGEA